MFQTHFIIIIILFFLWGEGGWAIDRKMEENDKSRVQCTLNGMSKETTIMCLYERSSLLVSEDCTNA